jgi:hypothetical protein
VEIVGTSLPSPVDFLLVQRLLYVIAFDYVVSAKNARSLIPGNLHGATLRPDGHIKESGNASQPYFAPFQQVIGRVLGYAPVGARQTPGVPKLEAYLDAYISAAGIANDKDGPLFRTTGRFTGTPHRMTQQDGHLMIQRRARPAGIQTRIGNHSHASHRHHRLPQERRHAGTLANDGRTFFTAHYQTPQPPQTMRRRLTP